MSGLEIFLIILVILLLGVGITFLVLWLVKKTGNPTVVLAITGTYFRLTDNLTTATATWESVGNPNDQVTMYADTIPINLTSGGIPDTSKNPNVLKSGPMPGDMSKGNSISIPNLAPNTLYFIKLVVTNSSYPGSSVAVEATLFTSGVPTTAFTISELHTPGTISVNNETFNSINPVVYRTTVNKIESDVLNYDVGTPTTPGTFRLTQSIGRGETLVLFNNNNVLAATSSSNTSILTPANSQWVYDPSNRWCLKNSPTTCLNLSTPVSDGENITIVANSNFKTQWKNVSIDTTG